uniref:Uncharacterized protein n=1 Tax=Bracon brevicornis TaxID=1563983 RepID=A0A6V7HPD3_9HYME
MQLQDLQLDTPSKRGIKLADKSTIKPKGGTAFIIDVGDIYGPQWFSVLPGMSNDLILGMDSWITFKVIIDSFAQTWTLADSRCVYNLSKITSASAQLLSLSTIDSKRLHEFLDIEFKKFDRESTGKTDLIEHVIELNGYTPHREKPRPRSELIRKIISIELLKKGYIVRSNSEWACSPVIAPKANGGLRFCINYKPINRPNKKPAYSIHNMKYLNSIMQKSSRP